MAKITKSSTAEYFAKNLQQVGFSSPLKAVLTTLKEAVDNSLDACEEAGILPELKIRIKKLGQGSSRSTDLISVVIEDNGPGLEAEELPKVFGEYLVSSKFGRGQCSRGQQGIGISAATTWAQLTNASGVRVLSKTKKMRKALKAIVDVDIKSNKGILKNKEIVDWANKRHGLKVEFNIDGRIQLNGDGGLLTYLEGTTLVNPHLALSYELMDIKKSVERVSEEVPLIPPPTLPHPHTMKWGEFLAHSMLYSDLKLKQLLKKGFSRITDKAIADMVKNGLKPSLLTQLVRRVSEENFKKIFRVIQDTALSSPSTRSVLTVGEEGLAKSIYRLGEVDFFSVVTRKPRICDYKPVVVEVAIARFLDKKSGSEENHIQLLRFANRVPLQFDKSACAITRAVESVNWRSYGLSQSKKSLPFGPYIFAVSVTSPFIKFKNASKETVDASDDLVEEIRRALMMAGQKLSRHIKKEHRQADLERKIAHIEKFGPILVEGLAKIVGAKESRKKKAQEGLKKILGRDAEEAETKLKSATEQLDALKIKQSVTVGIDTSLERKKESGEKKAVATKQKVVGKIKMSKGVKKKSKATRSKGVKKKSKATRSKVVKKKSKAARSKVVKKKSKVARSKVVKKKSKAARSKVVKKTRKRKKVRASKR